MSDLMKTQQLMCFVTRRLGPSAKTAVPILPVNVQDNCFRFSVRSVTLFFTCVIVSLKRRSISQCEISERVVGILTLLVGGAAQAFHDDRVVELTVQLGVEDVDGEGQEGTSGS